MILNSSNSILNARRIYWLLSLFILSSFSNMDFFYFEYEIVTSENTELRIQIHNGEPEYNITIYDNKPSDGGNSLYSINTSDKSYTFSNLPSGSYYVCVKDSRNYSHCQPVVVE